MELLISIVVIATSIWVLVDAEKIGVKKGRVEGLADLGPWGWFAFCILLWIIGFPYYLAKRGELKRIAESGPSSQQQPESFVCPVCSAENPLDVSQCRNCSHSFEGE